MIRSVILLLVLSLLLGGCGSQPTIQTVPTQVKASRTTLRWGLVGLADVPTLDPALASDSTSISLVSLIYGGLVRLDSHLHVQPDGAARWTISRDGKVYTFFLRRNLRFADGTRVRANDFAGALHRALGPEGSAGSASFYLGLMTRRSWIGRNGHHTVHGITVVDPETLRITLDRPAAHFLSELAFPASYVPDMRLLARYGASWTDHAAGFGPFSIQVWRHSRYLRLQRNPYYYAGQPALKRISLQFYPQQKNGIAAYQDGRLDLLSGLQAGNALATHPQGTESRPALALDYLAFNTARLPFSRLNVRRAFATAWAPGLVTRSMSDAAFPAHSFLPSAFGIPSPRWRPSAPGSRYLAQARYRHGKQLAHLTLVMPQDPHVYRLARELSRVWRTSLGLEIPVRQLNSPDYDAVLNAHAFDLAIVRWGAEYPDPEDFLGTQLGASADNVTGWSGRRYSRDVHLADSYSPSDPRRVTLFQDAAEIAARKVPLVPLDEPAQTAILSPQLTAVALTPLGTIVGDWERARLVRA